MAKTRHMSELAIGERLDVVRVTPCRPLHTAKIAIDYALERFHETWMPYRSITPTLYGIAPTGRGAYVTLGRLRAKHGMSWNTVDAVAEILYERYAATGYLIAGAAVGGSPLRPLFAIQGHDQGERHHGALDLASMTLYEGAFESELDLEAERWKEMWQEAITSSAWFGSVSVR